MNDTNISTIVWDMKYRLKSFDGKYVDKSIEDTWHRVASALASKEKDKQYWTDTFYSALTDFKLIPAGRISRGAGTSHNVTMINTFVMGMVPDNLTGILKNFSESALTLRQGGGIGCNFSQVRPKGAQIRGVESSTSGVIPFMEMWDQMCDAIMRGGVNRGAMMAMLQCDHPDIEEFIDAKRRAGRLSKFNLSVLITDAFMKAVEENKIWKLNFKGKVYKTLPAKELWDKIMKVTYEYSEPGVIFIDRINKENKLHYCEEIIGTNSCGEQPLPEYGSCPLGSINLVRLINNPFTPEAYLDTKKLEELTIIGVRLLDNTLDHSKYPLKKQALEAQKKRRIGLGITGLADALIMCNIRYGSSESAEMLDKWLKIFQRASYIGSIELAKEKEAFPLYEEKQYLASPAIHKLDDDVQLLLKKYGIRNALLNSIPPTGTTSLYAGNISSGIEPVYSFEVNRKILLPDGSHRELEINDYAFELYKKLKTNTTSLPKYFVTTEELSPDEHVMMQSTAQKYIDASISKTINCPEDMSFTSFENVYFKAYKLGCKGCTTYRPSDVRSHVLRNKTKSN